MVGNDHSRRSGASTKLRRKFLDLLCSIVHNNRKLKILANLHVSIIENQPVKLTFPIYQVKIVK